MDVATLTLNPAIDRTVTIPRFAAGAVNRVETSHDRAGGKGVNVAAALAREGFHTAATGFLGSDNAAIFEALFEEQKIEDHFIRCPGLTRVGIKIVDPAHKTTTDINFPGLTPSPEELARLRQAISAIQCQWWVLAGSLPPGVPASIYRGVIASLKSRGARVALDASGQALREGIEAAPHLVKPNVHELRALLGRPLEDTGAIVGAARELIALGIETVVVSMGAEGALFVTADAAILARPPSVEIGSTAGAGDAMVAGCVAARLRSLPLAGCARLATAFSLRTLMQFQAGADAAIHRIAIETVPSGVSPAR
ncbi:MAG TPA: 1-phosphofructokinase [Chthoniobacteraceae bacterium]|nr:1-phosphofructokinase [Chthoniobacteraceae bacterium]